MWSYGCCRIERWGGGRLPGARKLVTVASAVFSSLRMMLAGGDRRCCGSQRRAPHSGSSGRCRSPWGDGLPRAAGGPAGVRLNRRIFRFRRCRSWVRTGMWRWWRWFARLIHPCCRRFSSSPLAGRQRIDHDVGCHVLNWRRLQQANGNVSAGGIGSELSELSQTRGLQPPIHALRKMAATTACDVNGQMANQTAGHDRFRVLQQKGAAQFEAARIQPFRLQRHDQFIATMHGFQKISSQ